MDRWSFLRFLGACCLVVFCPSVLVFVGGFPVRQGVVLGLLMAWLAFGIRMQMPSARRFIPYWVRVSPNWYQILTDFKLISSVEEWRSVLQSASTDYCVLRDGVLFTVVQESEDFEHTLIFWNQHQAFGSEFRFMEDMTPIQFKRMDPMGGHLPARFFMKPWAAGLLAGYSLGIEVRDWWWEKMKTSCVAPLAVDTNLLTGSVDLTLATLPRKEFDLYWGCWTEEYITKVKPKIRVQRDEARQKLGWTAEEHQADDFHPYGGWPAAIVHKYFHIQHHAI